VPPTSLLELAPVDALLAAVAGAAPPAPWSIGGIVALLRLDLLTKLLLAVLLGGAIGFERELNGKPAGLRTNILICVGAALYMLVGLLLVHAGQERNSDATRIAAQVVTGIGFLGAGCIIQQGAQVTGLTSAATIWVVAAIGIVAGAGFPIIAFIATVMVVLTLVALREVEARWVRPTHPDDTMRAENAVD
jgi:putative Mg2+ transporter-C (MgtC) family protein